MLYRLGRGMSVAGSLQSILPTDIDGNLSNVIFDVDATQITSYDGVTGKLFNQANTGTEYDFYLGAASDGSDDPEFVGTAGTPGAYFNMDNGFRGFMVVQGGVDAVGQPAFFRDFHKAIEGKAVTMVLCFKSPPSWGVADSVLMGTQNNVAKHGFKLTYTTGGGAGNLKTKVFFTIDDGASGIEIGFPGSFIPEDKEIMLALTLEHTGTTTTATLRINGTHERTNSATVTTTTDADGKMTLMNDDSFTFIAPDTRFYAASGFERALSDEEFEILAGIYQLRHSRDYIDAPDISSLSSLHIRLHNFMNASDTVVCQEVQIYDGGVKGVGTEIWEGLGFVNGAPGNDFTDIVAGQITSDSNFVDGARVGRLTDGWSNTLPHHADGDGVGGLGVWAKFSSTVDLKQISMRFQSLDINTQDIQDFIFLTDDNEYIYPVTAPADLDDQDTSLDSPNTNAYTWLF